MLPGVTAIVVNWNGAEYLGDCLRSLRSQTHRELQIVVVDNNSCDNSSEIARGFAVDWVQLDDNVGLAPAMNIGAAHAKYALLLFLNNDMRFEPDFLAELVACHEKEAGRSAVDAVQRDWTTGQTVHAATRLERATGRDDVPGWRFQMAPVAGDERTLFASGANTLIGRNLFETIGGWDARFFAGWEDVDLGWRLWLDDKYVTLASKAVAIHDVSASSKTEEGRKIRTEAALHGRIVFAVKHAPLPIIGRVALRFLGGSLAALARNDRPGLIIRRRVLSRLCSDIPGVWAWRRRSYRARSTSPSRQWRRMAEIGRDVGPPTASDSSPKC